MKIHTKKVTKEYVTGVTYTATEFTAILKDMLANNFDFELQIPNTDGWYFDGDTDVKVGGEVTLTIVPDGEYGLPVKVGVERPVKKKVTKK